MVTLLLVMSVVIFVLVVIYIHGDYMFNYGKVIKGKTWTSKQYGHRYVISIKNHSEIVEAFNEFVKRTHIKAGTISGIGAVNSVTLRCFNPDTKQYVNKTFNEQMEISNLTGNISRKKGSPYVHIHVTLGAVNYNAYAGHLLAATINGAGEFVVNSMPHGKLERIEDPDTGLNIYKL